LAVRSRRNALAVGKTIGYGEFTIKHTWGHLARTFVVVAVLLPSAAPGRLLGDEAEKDSSPFKNLKFRSIGPAAGGRVSRSVGVPGDAHTYYAATAGGGLWKSGDGGLTWKSVFDDQPISSLGSVAVAPSDPNVVYVGSGEANIRGNVQPGNGIYRSTDAGKTWKHVWKQEGQIGRIIVDPHNADVAFAAVLGHAFGPNPERGVYRTRDGGKTWQQVLKKDADTGAIDVCLDPSNPRILFAALWQARRRPWELTSGGPGSGLYRSDDGGDTWKQVTGHGLPGGPWGRIGLALAPSDGKRVYALNEADNGGLYRSDDGGKKWELVNGSHYLRIRPWYFSTVTVDPANADVVWCMNLNLLKSLDGGRTFKKVKGPHHVDHHDLWIDPKDPKRMINSNDGGVDVTANGGATWFAPPLPIAQFYHISVDNRVPYHVAGTMQDLGTASGPSNSLSTAGIELSDWYGVGGGETGFTAPDPRDPNIVYAGEYGGYISHFDFRTRQIRNISIYPFNPSGHGAEDLRYRFQWTAPILVSPHDPDVVYHASNVLFRTADAGKSWKAISPDLTRNDKGKQKWSGGPITGDNTTAEYYDTIFALAESPKKKGVLWAGSDDGLVHVSLDGGGHWQDVTRGIPGLPEWGTVCCIEASPFDPATAYVVVDAHRLDDMRPYLWKTTDYGKNWTSLSGNLPQDLFLRVVREDPKRPGLLYAGTERGLLCSPDGGGSWLPLKMKLPTVAVTDLAVKGNDLVVGTNGRSIWILDDLTPVRELAPHLAARKEGKYPEAMLLPVQPAIRWRYHSPIYSTAGKWVSDNPPKGAIVHYYLDKEPKNDITLDVLDAAGTVVQTLTSKKLDTGEAPEDDPDAPFEPYKQTRLSKKAGLQRIVWDLRYKGADVIKGAKVDAGQPRMGPFVNPGTYTLKLAVEGRTWTNPVQVRLDLRVKMSDADLTDQLKLALAIRDDISRVARIVNALRAVKSQLASRAELLKDNSQAEPLVKQSKEVVAKLDALEEKLHNPRAQVVYDILAQKGGAKLYSQLGALYEWSADSDGPPTQGMREVYREHVRDLERLEAEWNQILKSDLPRLTELARSLDVPAVIVPGAGKAARRP
jgi:photosystem II stability/assembly factor-like uncharacterized protein